MSLSEYECYTPLEAILYTLGVVHILMEFLSLLKYFLVVNRIHLLVTGQNASVFFFLL